MSGGTRKLILFKRRHLISNWVPYVQSVQGRIQKFFEGGVLKIFCMDGKI